MKNPFPCFGKASRGTWILTALIVSLWLITAGRATAQIYTDLYSFEYLYQPPFGFPNGEYPYSTLVQGSDGDFYGTTSSGGPTTSQGGTNNLGAVFKISANGVLTSLSSFTGGNDGALPYSGLVQGSDGYFYGTTSQGGTNNLGAVFKISTNGALTSLYSFTGGNDGANPEAGLVQGNDGSFYSTTYSGGTSNLGTVFKISANGALASLYSFTGGYDGANPQAGLVQGRNGNFYGTTYFGGTNDLGTVFKISTNGLLISLYSFTGGLDVNSGYFTNGAQPAAELVLGRDGNLYGTTAGGYSPDYGGNIGWGNVFRLALVPEPPELTIIGYGANVILTWPTNATGFNNTAFIVEFATNLASPTVWKTNSAPTIVIGGQNIVINPITGSQAFYRLKSP